MSAIARQRSDNSPEKKKASRQSSLADAAEADSKEEQDRKKREEEAARRREERKRLDELQRRKDEEDAEDAARRIVDSASRFARLKLEEEQRRQKKEPLQQIEDMPECSFPPPLAVSPLAPSVQRDEGATPARAGASSPVKKYLRNELRFALLDTLRLICSAFHYIRFSLLQRSRSQKQEYARRKCWQFGDEQGRLGSARVRGRGRRRRDTFSIAVGMSQATYAL